MVKALLCGAVFLCCTYQYAQALVIVAHVRGIESKSVGVTTFVMTVTPPPTRATIEVVTHEFDAVLADYANGSLLCTAIKASLSTILIPIYGRTILATDITVSGCPQ